MNAYQELWWEQAQSDHEVFLALQTEGFRACHLLHYLQMATEKIAKAYMWRNQSVPPRSHAGFVQFLRFLPQGGNRDRIANTFGFKGASQFEAWLRNLTPHAHNLQNLAPALAQNGPNPEYPWPHAAPTESPVGFDFSVWRDLRDTAYGRGLLTLIQTAIQRFDQFADL